MARNRKHSQDTDVLNHLSFVLRAYFPKEEYDPEKGLSVASEAYRAFLELDMILKGDYGFIWKIGRVGRLVIKLKRKSSYDIPMDVVQLQMAIGRGDLTQMPFDKTCDEEQQMEIHVPLDAAYFRSERLSSPSPCFGYANQQYCPLNVILDIMIGNDKEDVRTFKHTVYCCIRQNRRMPFRAAVRACIDGWRALPSVIKIPVACIGVCGKFFAKSLATGLPLFLTSCVKIE